MSRQQHMIRQQGVDEGYVFATKPDDYSNLYFWFDATDSNYTTKSGNQLTQWDDKGPQGYSISNSDSNIQLVSNNNFDGKEVVDFTGGSTSNLPHIELNSAITAVETTIFEVMLFRDESNDFQRMLSLSKNTANDWDGQARGWVGQNFNNNHMCLGGNNGNYNTCTGGGNVSGNALVGCFRTENGAWETNLYRSDGNTYSNYNSNNGNFTSWDVNKIRIGGECNYGSSACESIIAEVWMYDFRMTNTQMNDIFDNYIQPKYNWTAIP